MVKLMPCVVLENGCLTQNLQEWDANKRHIMFLFGFFKGLMIITGGKAKEFR